jgi:Fe-S oxidoreductase
MTKCPYVPPHPWNVDFPHLMLRAKAVHAKKEGIGFRNQVLASTDTVGKIAGIPVVAEVVNAVNASAPGRALLEKTLRVDRTAPIPKYYSNTARKQLRDRIGTTGGNGRDAVSGASPASNPAGSAVPAPSNGSEASLEAAALHERADADRSSGLQPAVAAAPATPQAVPSVRGKVALFTTCYGNRNHPDLAVDLVAVFEHNGIEVRLVAKEVCCGMPKLELGDLEAVAANKERNIPQLMKAIEDGYDIVAPIPSCVLMFKQELPLMFPDDAAVQTVRSRIFDPFEYLMLRHRAGLLRTDFKQPLGKVSYHVPCHLRVQNIGLKTRDLLKLVPDTTVDVIERCSGHNGTYAVKKEFRAASVKIGRPVMTRVENAKPAYYASDCPMAGRQIESGLTEPKPPTHPLKLLRIAYGI